MSNNNRRVQMDLTPKSFERLERMKALTESASYSEVMKDALRLYEFMAGLDPKARFFVEEPGQERREVMLFAAA